MNKIPNKINLKEILKNKDEIISITEKLGFDNIAIHNCGLDGVYPDNQGRFPLGLVATTGSFANNAICCSHLGLLLKCKINLLTEDPINDHSFFLKNSVALTDANLEEKLITLFGAPLEEIEFSPLDDIDIDIARERVKEKDNS